MANPTQRWLRVRPSPTAAEEGWREGLRARLADPLWLLARQWQVGELRGEDAATPVLVRGEAQVAQLIRLDASGRCRVADQPEGLPLEPWVEAEPVREGPGGPRLAVDLGQQLRRALHEAGLPRTWEILRKRYPVKLGEDAPATLRVLARGSLDGLALESALSRGAASVCQRLRVPSDEQPGAIAVLDRWRARAASLVVEPDGASTWDRASLSYGPKLGAALPGGGVTLKAQGNPGGMLTWDAFSIGEGSPVALPADAARVVPLEAIPAGLQVRGLPNPRFWAVEDESVNFDWLGRRDDDPVRRAVASFALVGVDDWHLLSLTVPANSLTTLPSLKVLDSFGVWTDVPALAELDASAKESSPCRIWTLSGADSSVLLCLRELRAVEGEPVEQVVLRRDGEEELAWALELLTEGADGRPVSRAVESPLSLEAPAEGRWEYKLLSEVPAHQIPFVPREVNGRRVWRRARLPVAEGAGPTAQGRILPAEIRPLDLEEQAVPDGSGVEITRRWQMARGPRGEVLLWVGRQRRPAMEVRVEGLAWDGVANAD